MPELSGIQFIKVAGERCKMVLVTAFHEYALEGYEYGVLDYLLKPVTSERFDLALQRINNFFETRPSEGSTVVLGAAQSLEMIFIKTEFKYQKVALSDILYLESIRDYVAVYTTTGKILTLESMRSLEQRLPAHQFVRIHKSYLIALAKIDYVERAKVVLGDRVLPISETYRVPFFKIIGDFNRKS